MSLNANTSPADNIHGLVARAIRGDAEAFGALYAEYLSAIYRYILLRVGDEASAEDLTEEVFVRAWEALPRYKANKYPFSSWLYRIAHNLVVDAHRKHQPLSLPGDELDMRPAAIKGPEETIVSRQEVEMLAQAVQILDDEDQQIVILRFVEGMSHREVANIIGKSEGAVRVQQHRALARLQEHLAGRIPGYE